MCKLVTCPSTSLRFFAKYLGTKQKMFNNPFSKNEKVQMIQFLNLGLNNAPETEPNRATRRKYSNNNLVIFKNIPNSETFIQTRNFTHFLHLKIDRDIISH